MKLIYKIGELELVPKNTPTLNLTTQRDHDDSLTVLKALLGKDSVDIVSSAAGAKTMVVTHQNENMAIDAIPNLLSMIRYHEKDIYNWIVSDTVDSSVTINTLNKTFQQVQNIISESRPSLAASLSHCSIRETSTGHLEIETTHNEYTVKSLEQNLSFLEEIFKEHIGFKKGIILRNNVKILNPDKND